MSSTDAFFSAVDGAQGEQDLGPLAWVSAELRKSLTGAAKAVARFGRESELIADANFAELDTLPLRNAQQWLHQALGALKMVDQAAAALMVAAMEAAVLRLEQSPKLCTPKAVNSLEGASFALLEYLETVLAGRSVSPVALFPQYRDVQALAGNDKVHPADLWPAERRMREPQWSSSTPALPYGPQARALLDAAVLGMVKSGDVAAAAQMRATCLGFVAGQSETGARIFWKIAAGFFDAFAHGLLGSDVYVKRVASRVLLQYAAMAKGDNRLPERLTQDLLFFCAQAADPGSDAPVLRAVRESFALGRHPRVDYEQLRFGRFDPALLAQARKRVDAATKGWSALAGGDWAKIKSVVEQFSLISQSLSQLHPASSGLARALMRLVEAVARAGEPPAAALALEVATAVLYLQAAWSSPELADEVMTEHSARLAQRLDEARQGALAQPLEPWMEELYRRVSDSQTMGSVVGELRATMAEAESLLDQFFRNPQQMQVLGQAAGQLSQMRGVLSVLGLEQACQAMARMRETVEQLMRDEIPVAEHSQVFARLGNNLGALGFLIDMLSYQRALARKLFVYDEALGELRIIMGRNRVRESDAPEHRAQHVEARAPQPLPALVPREAPAEPVSAKPEPVAVVQLLAEAVAEEDTDEELLGIFLEEAREVVGQGLDVLAQLAGNAGQLSAQASLRRAFHTLKGSARMVGLDEFGEAGWAMEQLLNAWLAEQKPLAQAQQSLAHEALQAFAAWTQAIADGRAQNWSAAPFRAAADAMRLEGRRAELALQPPEALSSLPQAQDAQEVPPGHGSEAQEIDFAAFEAVMQASQQPPVVEVNAPAAAELLAQAAEPAPFEAADNIKLIDGLRIPLPLYNVYLNEADAWSRSLDLVLQEWAQDLQRPQPETAVGWAHSLAGSSATVGFKDLSCLARTLENALMHVRPQGRGDAQQLAVLQAAADEIRRLLHQFAAGFRKSPQLAVQESLQQLLATEIHSSPGHARFDAEDAIGAQELHLDEAPAEADLPQPSGASRSGGASLQAQAQQRLAAALALAVEMDSDIDDDIDVLDAIDPDLFAIFAEEAAELLPLLSTALRDWLAKPERSEARNASLRALHTLKGSARLAGAMRLGEMAHRLESAIEQVDSQAPQAAQIEPLLSNFDTLHAHFLVLRTMAEDADAVALAAPPEQASGAISEAPLGLRPATFTPMAPLVGARAAAQQLVRVRGQLLDRLINQSGEVLIARSRIDSRLVQARSSLADLNGNLERLRQQLRDIEVQAETQSRLALSKDSAAGFDPLEFDRFTRVQELTRMMAESVNDVATVQRNLQRDLAAAEDDLVAQGRQARELQRDLLRTRMVEFDAIAERLYAVVRQTAKETGKQVRLNIIGGTIEMDRGVLDRMAPAFEHLLRNCVAHGIEMPAEREALGKPVTGTIGVTLQHEGNDVSVRIEDDGAGLNFERIRATAVTRGLIAQEAVITQQQAAELIFEPGFTTATEVTGVSGRGIGMDVVRAEVHALGGRIETQSTPGAGTLFSLVLPLTTAVTQVVMLRVGKLAVGVPANLVEIVRRVPVETLDQAYRSASLEDAGSTLPFFWGGALWQSSAQSQEGRGKTRAVVIFRSASQRLALHVDEVLGNQELVVKQLGPQLARLPGLTGMSVLASGAVVLIYNPVALATVYGEQLRAQARQGAAMLSQLGGVATAEPAGAGEVPWVLVVDDSITVRRVTQRLLQREGYRVEVAADGLQALERLQGERPAVLLSDIEMPRMDGFDLAQQIRSDERLHDLPIIMITSRIAQKHREHARELGVNHYLGKPYSDEELLSLVRHYATQNAEQPAEQLD